jgi:hypothetical protein
MRNLTHIVVLESDVASALAQGVLSGVMWAHYLGQPG